MGECSGTPLDSIGTFEQGIRTDDEELELRNYFPGRNSQSRLRWIPDLRVLWQKYLSTCLTADSPGDEGLEIR